MPDRLILLGVIGRPHGVRGHVHVVSHTDDPASLAEYGPLLDERGRRFALRWKTDGIASVALLQDGREVPVADRDAAARLTNTLLYIERDRLPAPEEDEFYLADLDGLAAYDAAGTRIGHVAQVHDYGAGVSLEIARDGAAPLLVPFTRAAVPEVDLAGGRVVVAPPVEAALTPALSRDAGEGAQASPPSEQPLSRIAGEGGTRRGCDGRVRE